MSSKGGDGTLNETISGLMALEQRPPLGYLPNGSTNDFAASLHLHTTLEAAARAAAAYAYPPAGSPSWGITASS